MTAIAALPPPVSSSSSESLFGAIGNRVSRVFAGKTTTESSNECAIVPTSTSRTPAKRSYGFATTNLSHFSDQNSEHLFRYKNISSDYMREISPTREENVDDDDDRPAVESNDRRADNIHRSVAPAHSSRRSNVRANITQNDEQQPTPDTTEENKNA